MDNRITKQSLTKVNNGDYSSYCMDRLKVRLEKELAKYNCDFKLIFEVLEEGLDNLLWKNRMTDIEVRVYDDFVKYSELELECTDIQCGALTQVRRYIGHTNIVLTDKLSFKDVGIVRHVLFGDEAKVCSVLYRQVDTSDRKPHRDILAIYIPEEYKFTASLAHNVIESKPLVDKEITEKQLSNDFDNEVFSEFKIGKFTKIVKDDV